MRKQREETRTVEQQYQQDQKKDNGVTFDQWLANKQKNERTLRRKGLHTEYYGARVLGGICTHCT